MKTARDFEFQYFDDDYRVKCSIQESSSVEPHIWLGVDEPEIKMMYKDAQAAGLNLKKDAPESNDLGWCTYPLPEGARNFSRMYLNQKQAKKLVKELRYWIRHGKLKEEQKNDAKDNR